MLVADIEIAGRGERKCRKEGDGMKSQMLLTDFRESNQLAAGLSGFIDEVDSLLNTGLEVEPLWRISNDSAGRCWVSSACNSLLAPR